MKRRRIWSEHVSVEEATAPEVLSALYRADVQLIQAVFPGSEDRLVGLVRSCRDRGVSIGLWPMIADDEGRWASADNGERYAEFARAVLDTLGDDTPDTLAIDLEPPIREVRRIIGADPRPLIHRVVRRPPEAGIRALAALVDDANASGIETLATLVPPLGTGWGGSRGFERALGSPLSRIRPTRVGPMTYTTLFTGYGRGVLRRRDAQCLLSMIAEGAREHLGDRATLSLGAVGVGALGDERVYPGPADLAEDVAIARAAGVDDLALFDLGGLLARPPVEAWLTAFTETEAARRIATPSKRARLIRLALSASGAALSGLAATVRSGRRRDPR